MGFFREFIRGSLDTENGQIGRKRVRFLGVRNIVKSVVTLVVMVLVTLAMSVFVLLSVHKYLVSVTILILVNR